MKQRQKTFNTVITALFAAIIAVGAIISLNVADVPFTLQSFAVFLALGTIGWKRGTLSIAVYLLLGLVGVPVFAGFRSGPAVLAGPTGGFLIGFIFTGLVYGPVSSLLKKTKLRGITVKLISMLAGDAVLYLFGSVMYAAVYLKDVSMGAVGTAVSACVIPFLIPDAVKIITAAFISQRLEKMNIMKKYSA